MEVCQYWTQKLVQVVGFTVARRSCRLARANITDFRTDGLERWRWRTRPHVWIPMVFAHRNGTARVGEIGKSARSLCMREGKDERLLFARSQEGLAHPFVCTL